MTNADPGLRAIWQRLEEYRSLPPLDSGRCRSCGKPDDPMAAVRSICGECNERRLRLKERFDRFPAPADAREPELPLIVDEPQQPVMELPRRKEWLPYPEDRD